MIAPSIPLPRVGEEIAPMTGVRVWRNALNGFAVAQIHYTADPSRRGDWKYRAAPKYGGLRSWRWRKEQEIDWSASAGRLVFELWDPDAHTIRPFPVPAHWPRWLLFDPGWSNPSGLLWAAVDVDSEPNGYGYLPVHVYREFYRARHSAEACARIASDWSKTAETDAGEPTWEHIERVLVDPAAKQEHQSAAAPDAVNESAATVLDKFTAALAQTGWPVPVDTGNNHKDTSIEEMIARLGLYWTGADGLPLYDENDEFREPELEELAAGAVLVEPTLFFHHTCPNAAHEMGRYRWRDWASNVVAERHNTPEQPVDKDDHQITNLIRLMNLLREARTDDGPDLSAFDARPRPKRWVPDDERIQAEYRTRAARYRRRLARAGKSGGHA